jgi:hypothetical protein
MHFTTRMMIPAAAFAITISASPLMAQQPDARPSAPATASAQAAPQRDAQAQETTVEGDVSRVDNETKQFWIRAAGSDQERAFKFTDDTVISREGASVEGLATMTGSRVKVTYKIDGTSMTATKIEIQPRTAQQPAAAQPQPSPAPAPAPAQTPQP